MKIDSMSVPMFHGNFSYQVPMANLAERFGPGMAAGLGFKYKTRSNWTFGLDGYYFFGGQIREDSILNGIIDSQDNLINKYGEIAKVALFERGYYAGIKFGKVFRLPWTNPNSGILLELGGGFMEHWIRIENSGNNVPQILNDYAKGYDRRTNGLAATQFIGYSHLGVNQRTNFFIGVEFTEGWTKNRRNLNFDTMSRDDRNRFDMLCLFKIGLLIPMYRQTASEYFSY